MQIDFKKGDGLVPAIIQDADTHQVLMLGYMNEEALIKTKAEGRVTFFSRSKDRLWTKGETSGNFLNLVDIKIDCDQDTLLVRVHPVGPACHTGSDTCFNEVNQSDNFLPYLEQVIHDRKDNPSEQSYTTSLFKKGINKIAQKVGEEAVEVVIEAKDNNKELFLNEAADLTFHLLVLLAEKDYRWEEVLDVLRARHK
ncbi:MAG: bifunctional phosphoribosyl-AMP cyclohydrolase/phosphoribosyl-ATP diphosphatase HisIE [Lewinella sp.]|nr:bifunctional phosphoribosyl-AMP cyclohydrolase/phosphoribosyl-ATP diphosphatase HisIE [Lewinella sp.]